MVDYKITLVNKIESWVVFSNHDLGMNCGRRMFYSGLAIEEIPSIGHEDTKTKLKYLGLDHRDLSDAMDLYYQHDQRAVFPKMDIFDESQGKSG